MSIETILIVLVVTLQIIFFLKTKNKINGYSSIFPEFGDEEDLEEDGDNTAEEENEKEIEIVNPEVQETLSQEKVR